MRKDFLTALAMQSGLKILKAQRKEREGGGYLCTQWRQLKCFLHDISFLHDSLNEKFPSWVRCASSFKVPRKSFQLQLDAAEEPVSAAWAKNKLLPLQLDEEEGRGCSSHLFITQRFWQLIYPMLKNPSLQKAWEADSGGFSCEKERKGVTE